MVRFIRHNLREIRKLIEARFTKTVIVEKVVIKEKVVYVEKERDVVNEKDHFFINSKGDYEFIYKSAHYYIPSELAQEIVKAVKNGGAINIKHWRKDE